MDAIIPIINVRNINTGTKKIGNLNLKGNTIIKIVCIITLIIVVSLIVVVLTRKNIEKDYVYEKINIENIDMSRILKQGEFDYNKILMNNFNDKKNFKRNCC